MWGRPEGLVKGSFFLNHELGLSLSITPDSFGDLRGARSGRDWGSETGSDWVVSAGAGLESVAEGLGLGKSRAAFIVGSAFRATT